jgi:hypothetical protein
MATLEIDDRQASEPKARRAVKMIALIVRASVTDRPGHLLEFAAVDSCPIKKVILSTNSAHQIGLVTLLV